MIEEDAAHLYREIAAPKKIEEDVAPFDEEFVASRVNYI